MSATNDLFRLPDYVTFVDAIALLALPISASELHGVMCGYLCAGAVSDGEAYLRALVPHKSDAPMRNVILALFGVYAVSQQQLINFDFEFQLLLPDEEAPLFERATAFSEWCEGFTQGMAAGGVGYDDLQEEEAQEALQHLADFAQLDQHSLSISEEDERALMEVNEYARVAVLRIYSDWQLRLTNDDSSERAH